LHAEIEEREVNPSTKRIARPSEDKTDTPNPQTRIKKETKNPTHTPETDKTRATAHAADAPTSHEVGIRTEKVLEVGKLPSFIGDILDGLGLRADFVVGMPFMQAL